MTSLVTPEVWKILLESKPPHPGLRFQPVEYDYYISIRLFLTNFAEFSEPQRQDLATWIGSLVQRIRDIGIPCYLEAVEDDPVTGEVRRKIGRSD